MHAYLKTNILPIIHTAIDEEVDADEQTISTTEKDISVESTTDASDEAPEDSTGTDTDILTPITTSSPTTEQPTFIFYRYILNVCITESEPKLIR